MYLKPCNLFCNLKQSLRNSELPLCCKNIINLYVKGRRVVREATQGRLALFDLCYRSRTQQLSTYPSSYCVKDNCILPLYFKYPLFYWWALLWSLQNLEPRHLLCDWLKCSHLCWMWTIASPHWIAGIPFRDTGLGRHHGYWYGPGTKTRCTHRTGLMLLGWDSEMLPTCIVFSCKSLFNVQNTALLVEQLQP